MPKANANKRFSFSSAHIWIELDGIFHPDQGSSKTDKYSESYKGSKFLTLRQAIDCKMDTFFDKKL